MVSTSVMSPYSVSRPRPDRHRRTRMDNEVFVRVSLTHEDAQRLIAEVQAEYVVRYGGEDATPLDPAMFEPPRGAFFVAYRDGVPVATGAWRLRDDVEAFGTRQHGRGQADVRRPGRARTRPRPADARPPRGHGRRRGGRGDDPRDGHGAAGGHGALRELRLHAHRELRSLPRGARRTAATAATSGRRGSAVPDGGLGVAEVHDGPGGGAVEQRDPQGGHLQPAVVGQVRDAGLDADERGQLGRQLGRLTRAAACRSAPGRSARRGWCPRCRAARGGRGGR